MVAKLARKEEMVAEKRCYTVKELQDILGGKPPHSIQSPEEKSVPLGTLRRRKIQDFQEKL